LSHISGGVLRGEVTSLETKAKRRDGSEQKRLHHFLNVIAPAAGNLRRRVVSIIHAQDGAYPVSVLEINDNYNDEAASEDQFIQMLARVLTSSETISVLQSLIARSNEADSVETAPLEPGTAVEEGTPPGEDEDVAPF
jgi:hypothetical protein